MIVVKVVQVLLCWRGNRKLSQYKHLIHQYSIQYYITEACLHIATFEGSELSVPVRIVRCIIGSNEGC